MAFLTVSRPELVLGITRFGTLGFTGSSAPTDLAPPPFFCRKSPLKLHYQNWSRFVQGHSAEFMIFTFLT
jgi:hypothetical protein